MNLSEYGFLPAMIPEPIDATPARITAVHKGRYELVCEYGECFGQLKSSVYYGDGSEEFPATGDFVLFNYNTGGDSLIVKTLPRKSKFSRSNFAGHTAGYAKTVLKQVVAANFDYVFIMASLNKDFNVRRIERYLTLAWESGAVPVIVLTKADLADDYSGQLLAAQKAAAGVGVIAVSVVTGSGLDDLSDYLQPCKTAVLLGSSGVGKSSLVNALAGEELMTVNEIREDDSKGRHTTTHRQLIMLKSGAMIIDTPGMRELGMVELSTGLEEAFGDVEQYFGRCKFNDCRHQTEPGCAVMAALACGALSEKRWNSYINLKREAEFYDDKAGYLHRKEQWGKEISKWSKQKNKYGGIKR